MLVGVALGREQLLADFGGTDAGEEPLGLELGVGLALAIDDVLDILEQVGQVVFDGPTPSSSEGIKGQVPHDPDQLKDGTVAHAT